MTWRTYIRYPQTHRHPNAGTLDLIEELVGCRANDDKYYALGQMLRDAKGAGIITVGEYFDLRTWLANEELG